ncbi:hypothetical protein BH23CHL5_BH23CHL5_05750 [soil metagenome]
MQPPPHQPQPAADRWSFDVAEHLSADTLGELVDRPSLLEDSTAISTHLQSCSECSVRLDELIATVRVFDDLQLLDPPRSFAIRQQAVIRREARAKSWFDTLLNPAFPAFRIASAGVLAIFVVATTGALFSEDRNPPDQPSMVLEADSPAMFRETTSESGAESIQETGPVDEPESANAEMAAPADAAVTNDTPESGSTGSGDEIGDDTAIVEGDGDQLTGPSEPVTQTEGVSNWRLAQITSVLLLGWLTVTWIGLERLRRRDPRSSNA